MLAAWYIKSNEIALICYFFTIQYDGGGGWGGGGGGDGWGGGGSRGRGGGACLIVLAMSKL